MNEKNMLSLWLNIHKSTELNLISYLLHTLDLLTDF